ncbi:MAG: hypothetical protein DGJ47_000109 [Rickettsiaceae bacterium]
MPKLTINDQEIEVESGKTVMQACNQMGIEIPHFCYHEKLEVAGNCRMCLVEMERSPKPIASCAMIAADGMKIYTNTQKVQKAREGVMGFLLINHPLDCPVCDQGGECDLQDQAFKYGKGKSKFEENKRGVEDKNIGPLVKTHMTRCIHCTRCIRFSTDVAGVPEMGAINRGEDMEIVSYLEKSLTSELSGNVIDLCPVGALTSKPYAFTARPWELKKTASIDVMDAVGSNIYIDSKDKEVMRILPKPREDINEEWISDKIRFSYDGLKVQRLDAPYARGGDGRLERVSWDEVIMRLNQGFFGVKTDNIAALIGTSSSCEAMFAVKDFINALGSEKVDANPFGYYFDTSSRGNYLFNTTISGIEKADICLVIGADIRKSSPVLNSRIGKSVRQNNLVVYNIGEDNDQTYPTNYLGDEISIIKDISEGKGAVFEALSNAKRPMVIIGDGVYAREDAKHIFGLIGELVKRCDIIKPDWNGYNIMHNHSSSVGSLDLGINYGERGTENILKKTQTGEVKFLYLLSADDIDINKISKDCFVVYQGHHGDKCAARADIILPEAAFTEQDGLYVNLEGRVQRAKASVSKLGEAKSSVDVIIALATRLNRRLSFSSQEELSKKMLDGAPFWGGLDVINESLCEFYPVEGVALEGPIRSNKTNYYMDNIICKFSATMAKCSAALSKTKDLEVG